MKIKQRGRHGFSLIETLITIVLVGILSMACATMMVFAYSMFEKVMGNGTASIEYKTFRFRTEKIFRNMTKDGPLIYDWITDDVCSKDNRPPATPKEEENCIKMDVEYFPIPYAGEVFTRKYYQTVPGAATTKYKVNGGAVDPGIWEGHVGRTVAVYSCVENEKIDKNYKRYLMTLEKSTETAKKMVVLYSWDANLDSNGKFLKIDSESMQNGNYNKSDASLPGGGSSRAQREVLLHDVYDFQVTARLSNLALNRITDPDFENIAVVRLFVKLGEAADAQYSNDFIFANKAIYGNIDSFFTGINESYIVP
ncbi:MAG: prepilin-type N-terminal cleavage/methylation domain-containing protein [Endomicrobium sp.]|jgi:prepilin-type N-terminal cleavage/methylation domain-containing protein|nr:prepilin-type N-terminal cleavage/methylation domain-containing protein [Endomicrobium sp.]